MRFVGKYAREGSTRRHGGHRLAVALAAIGVLAAACSSASGSSPSASTSHGASAKNATRTPINIGVLASVTGTEAIGAGAVDGAKAAVAAVNNAGGVNGHPLNLIVCDDQDNPNVAAECGHQMVSSHVVYVDNGSTQENSFMPILRSAGIPVTSATGVQSDILTFPNSYILGSGLSSIGGGGAECAKLGSRRIGIAQSDLPGIAALVATIYKTISPFGLTRANTSVTLIPPTAVDFSAYAAALIQKSNCIVEVLPPNDTGPFTAAVHAQNPSIPVVELGATTATQWKTLGKRADNLCILAAFPSANLTGAPGMAQYNSEMDKYNKSGLRELHSIAAWSSVHLAAKLLANMPSPTAAAYMHALNTAGTINMPPLPPLNFARPTNLVPGITRYMSEDVVLYHYLNGAQQVEPFYGGNYVDVMSLKSQPAIPTAPHC